MTNRPRWPLHRDRGSGRMESPDERASSSCSCLSRRPVLPPEGGAPLSVISDLVARLIASGTPPEVAACVVAEAFSVGVLSVGHVTSADESVTHRRESDRLRKQRSRDRLVTKRDVTGQSQDASLSKEERIESKEVRKRETTRGSRLPDSWTPTVQDWASTCELLTDQTARSELEKFRDHWAQQPGGRGVKLDWGAAWRNWTRRAVEYGTRPNGNGNGHGKAKTGGSLIAALDAAIEQSQNADLAAAANPILRLSGGSIRGS